MTTAIKTNYRKEYDFSSTESHSADVVLAAADKKPNAFPLTDSNKKVGTLNTTILTKFNLYAQQLVTKFSGIAFENSIHILMTAYKSGYSVKVVDCLQNDEGIFIDCLKGEVYKAFELYNDGGIIEINKSGTQNSIVTEHESVESMTL